MKASLRWIQEFIDLPDSDPDVVEEVLSNLGIEVEGYEIIEPEFTGVVVARVLEVNPHPNADKVRIATLDAGGQPIEVVCGAWNFEAGATVAYATVGAVLPGGFEIGEKPVRGVMSPGMICSEVELGLGDESGGILVLDDDHAAPGTDFASTLPYPDVLFDLSITPNRPDAMSIHGIARDLGAFHDVPVRMPEIEFTEEGTTRAEVRIEAPERCPRFTAREVAGLTVSSSPLWMRLRLRDAGVRAISNVVDVTNYVMLELGQPLHAFDLDKITDETIVVRLASEGERLVTLDGVERSLTSEDLVIAGVDEPLGLAGIMGGGDSEVSDSTTRVLIEVAHFEPTRVLLSGKRHALRTEAVARFERGVDPELPPVASARAATLIGRLGGGTVVGGFVDEYPNRWQPITIELPAGEAERLLGDPIDVETQRTYLTRFGFGVEGDGPLLVTVPSFRPDVTRPADLVEEIARLHGYNVISSRLAIGTGGGLTAEQRATRALRAALVGAGYYEIMSFDFLAGVDIAAMGFPEGDRRADPVRIRNPLNDEQARLRTTLLPGLLAGLRRTAQRNRPDAALFEIGNVVLAGGDVLPEQPMRCALVATGARSQEELYDEGEYDARDAVGAIAVVLEALGVEPTFEQGEVPGFHPGRAVRVLINGTEVGFAGEIDPAVAAHWDLTGRVAAAELDLAAIGMAGPARFTPPSAYPPVVFDLAFDLPESAAGGDLIAAVRAAGGSDLERVEVFDVFRGAPLAADRKSIAVRLTLRSPDRTMTDEEAIPIREAIAARVVGDLGGSLRGG